MSVRSASLLRTTLRGARGLHTSARLQAATPFRFPAMSPTMTEGGIAEWKIKEGEAFSAGDVLLEIETDKATIDVETQEDGVLGKIIKQDGAKGIQVGELIGILVEEGDDTASLSADQFGAHDGDAPAPSSSSSSEPAPEKKAEKAAEPSSSSSSSSAAAAAPAQSHAPGHFVHAHPLSPSVARLLSSSSLSPEAVKALKGSGRGGYLTKGDVLKALGKVATVWGSKEAEALEKSGQRGVMERFAIPGGAKPASSADKKPPPPPQDALSLRRAVLSGLVSSSSSAAPARKTKATFDDVLADYGVSRPVAPTVGQAFGLQPAARKEEAFAGLW